MGKRAPDVVRLTNPDVQVPHTCQQGRAALGGACEQRSATRAVYGDGMVEKGIRDSSDVFRDGGERERAVRVQQREPDDFYEEFGGEVEQRGGVGRHQGEREGPGAFARLDGLDGRYREGHGGGLGGKFVTVMLMLPRT